MLRKIRGLAVATAVMAAACGASPGGPTPDPGGPLTITVSQLPALVPGTLVFGIRVDNISTSVVDVTFPSSCPVLPYFTDRSGRAVTPAGGGFACLTVITRQSFHPGVSFIQPFTVKAGAAPDGQFVVLPPGEYTIRGRLEDTVFRLESVPVPFALQ
jgi:hypothetical protein